MKSSQATQRQPIMSIDGVRYRIADGVLARPLGDTIVLFHPETERLVTLNHTGARIWALLSEGSDDSQIVARLSDEFEGGAPMIRQHLLRFVARLESESLIQQEG